VCACMSWTRESLIDRLTSINAPEKKGAGEDYKDDQGTGWPSASSFPDAGRVVVPRD
jgi:hypothetical protein